MKRILIIAALLLISASVASAQPMRIWLNPPKTSGSLLRATYVETPPFTSLNPIKGVWVVLTSTTDDTLYVKMRNKDIYGTAIDSTYTPAQVYQPEFSSTLDTSGAIFFKPVIDSDLPEPRYMARFRIYEMVIADPFKIVGSFLKPDTLWYDIYTEAK